MSTTLTSKCQVTIPKRIRESLGLGPGSQVDFAVDEQGRIIIRKARGKAAPRPRGRDRFARAGDREVEDRRVDAPPSRRRVSGYRRHQRPRGCAGG